MRFLFKFIITWALLAYLYPPLHAEPTRSIYRIEFADGTKVPIVQVLGEGGYGLVLAFDDPTTKEPKALKIYQSEETFKQARDGNAMLKESVNTSDLFLFPERALSVKATVPNKGIFEGPAFVFPRMDGSMLDYGQLLALTNEDSPFSMNARITIIHALASFLGQVLATLDRAGMLHLDVKLENILIQIIDTRLVFKLGDNDIVFPAAKFADLPEGEFGTPTYRAPELYSRAAVSFGADGKKADLFSAAVSLLALVTGWDIYEDLSDAAKNDGFGDNLDMARAFYFRNEEAYKAYFQKTADNFRRLAMKAGLETVDEAHKRLLVEIDEMIEAGITYDPDRRELVHPTSPAQQILSDEDANTWRELLQGNSGVCHRVESFVKLSWSY